jgi:molybdopterin/thiamine biosynthesis adenylyltransferase
LKDYFHRQIQLWGEEKQDLLQSKSIAIIGSGGLGCSLAIALGSSGIGTIYCVDFDKIEIHNIHRQIAFETKDEGKYKSEVLSSILKKRSPFVKAIPKNMDFEKFSSKNIELDLIIDATDNLHVRSQIDKYAKKTNTPWIYGSVEEFNGQVCFFKDSDFSSFKIKDKKPAGIAAPIVMHIASLQANLALRYLVKLPVKKDILYYLYFDDNGELITQKFNMPRINHG